MIKSGRWRGQMPFRLNHRLWPKPLRQRGRTGEPSLATVLDHAKEIHRQGIGKSVDSFTSRVDHELHLWLRKNNLSPHSIITFGYRLYRHRTVTIAVTHPYIVHDKMRGDGSKGFTLECRVVSIDGIRPTITYGRLALNRIVAHHPLRMLVSHA